jgi:hypothetical protein
VADRPQRGVFGKPRGSVASVARAVEIGGKIEPATLARLLALLHTRTDYDHHVEVAITVGALVKTIDNERDAIETIRRLERLTDKAVPRG